MTNRPVRPQYAINGLVLCILLLGFLLVMPSAHGEPGGVVVDFFYEDGCSKCSQAAPILDDVTGRYANITYSRYEVTVVYDGTTGYDRMKVYGVYSVPAVVINRQLVIRYSDYDGNETLLEELLVRGIETVPLLTDNNSVQPTGQEQLPELSLLVVLVAGLLAGFNPCLLAVMAFLASATLTSNGSRRDLLFIVGGFCFGIFVVYMAVGLGLLSIVKQNPGIKDTITLFLVVLIGLLGLWQLYDAYHLKRHGRSSFGTPKSFTSLVKLIKGRNILLVSILAGGVFSLIKAPCVGAVYFAILDMLISRGNMAWGSVYLAAYNFGVVLPVLILGILLAFGLSPERVDDIREKKRIEIRLVTGTVLILLAVLIYFNVI